MSLRNHQMNNIVQKNKDIFGQYHFIIMPVIVALMGVAGYGEYEKRQEPATVTVNIDSMPTVMTAHHDHHTHRSNQDIQAMIKSEMKEHQHGGKFH